VTGIVVLGAGSALDLYAAALAGTGRAVWVCDLDADRAQAAGRTYGFPRIDPAFGRFPPGSAVLNLTPPAVHGQTSTELLARGHPVYSEKPAAHDTACLRQLHQQLAAGARFAVAPDTHLGPAVTVAARMARTGELGPVRAIRGIYHTTGHETWHPRPWIFYGPGGGVCLDIAPYFLRAIEAIAGQLTLRAAKTASRARPDLTPPGITTRPVPARAQITLTTRSGIHAELDLSFDARSCASQLRISFTEGDLILDPVDGGSRLTLIRHRPRTTAELVSPGPDRRGAGLHRFLAGDPPDSWFGPGNTANVEREQLMLLAMDKGEHT
jgi:predicted dehydrogenase